jgi:hypothetical protein
VGLARYLYRTAKGGQVLGRARLLHEQGALSFGYGVHAARHPLAWTDRASALFAYRKVFIDLALFDDVETVQAAIGAVEGTVMLSADHPGFSQPKFLLTGKKFQVDACLVSSACRSTF